jgi:tRNA pseudouridine38-40 synthase
VTTFRLTIAYDGTTFVGWQRQAEGTSVQGLLEAAIGDLDGREVAVVGASRTDAGVHALGQAACATLHRTIDGPTLVQAVNIRLPPTVRVLDAVEVPASFNARFDAKAKTYRYRILNDTVVPPMEQPYVWHVPSPRLDVAAMADAARVLEGRHDFAAFQAAGSSTVTTTRVVLEATVVEQASPWGGARLVIFEVRGDGFLRHMVRAMMGTLVEVGRGARPPAWTADVLESRDRARAGRNVPPSGLVLVSVEYDASNMSSTI